MGIGNTIGQYMKASEATKQCKYTSYSHICVYMNIAKALPGAVILEYQDEDWSQTLNYEHILFRCRKCHEHDHLFRDFPLNQQAPKAGQNLQKDGFTTIQTRKKNPTQRKTTDPRPRISTRNAYDILSQLPEEEEVQDPHAGAQKGKVQNPEPPSSDPNKEINA